MLTASFRALVRRGIHDCPNRLLLVYLRPHHKLVNLVTGAAIWMIVGFALSLDAVNNPIKRALFCW
jgi:hypothetical protein